MEITMLWAPEAGTAPGAPGTEAPAPGEEAGRGAFWSLIAARARPGHGGAAAAAPGEDDRPSTGPLVPEDRPEEDAGTAAAAAAVLLGQLLAHGDGGDAVETPGPLGPGAGGIAPEPALPSVPPAFRDGAAQLPGEAPVEPSPALPPEAPVGAPVAEAPAAEVAAAETVPPGAMNPEAAQAPAGAPGDGAAGAGADRRTAGDETPAPAAMVPGGRDVLAPGAPAGAASGDDRPAATTARRWEGGRVPDAPRPAAAAGAGTAPGWWGAAPFGEAGAGTQGAAPAAGGPVPDTAAGSEGPAGGGFQPDVTFPVRVLRRDPEGRLAVRVEARELGVIDVEVREAAGRLDLGLRAVRAETADLLGQHLPELIAGLRGRRLDIGHAGVFTGFGPQGDQPAGHPSHQGAGQGQRPHPAAAAAGWAQGDRAAATAAAAAAGAGGLWTARLDVLA